MGKSKPKVDETEVRVSGQKWKFYTVLASAIFGVYGTVMSTIIQSTSAKEDSVSTLVTQMNDKVIPGIQDVLDTLSQDHYKLCERVARLEGREEVKSNRHNATKPEPASPDIGPTGRLLIPQLTPPEQLFQRKALPKLDMTQQEDARDVALDVGK